MFRNESFPSFQGCRLCIVPRTLAADGSVYAQWPLAAGSHYDGLYKIPFASMVQHLRA